MHQAAVRETREELGVVVDPAELEPMCVLHRTVSSGAPIDERVDFFFAARRWTGEPTTLEPAKSGGLAWYDLAELPETVVPHERRVLTAWRDGTLAPVLAFGFDPAEATEQHAAQCGSTA